MACQICDQLHAEERCPYYVNRMHQSIKDFVDAILVKHPFPVQASAMPPAETLRDEFYELYSGPVEFDLWECYGKQAQIAERIYLCVPSTHLRNVWSVVKTNFNAQTMHDFRYAKVCTPKDADLRRDTIVIYVASRGTNSVLNKLRELHQSPRPVQQGRPPLPARLKTSYFRLEVPRTTSPVSDLQGVSIADDPGPSESYGGLICGALAEAYVACDRTKWGFVAQVVKAFDRKKISLQSPWKKQALT